MTNLAIKALAVALVLVFVAGVIALAMGAQYACYRWVSPIFVGDDKIAQAIFCKATPGRP